MPITESMRRTFVMAGFLAILILASGAVYLFPESQHIIQPSPARAAFTDALPVVQKENSFQTAKKFIEAGQNLTADSFLDQCLSERPELSPYIKHMKAQARLAAGDTSAAVTLLAEVSAADGRAVALRAQEELAGIHRRSGNFDEASRLYRERAKTRSGDDKVRMLIEAARCEVSAGRKDAGVTLLFDALNSPVHPRLRMVAAGDLEDLLQPRGALGRRLADVFYAGGDYSSAARLYRRAIDEASVDPKVNHALLLHQYARSCERADDFGTAARAYQDLLKRHPGFSTALVKYHLGLCWQRTGEDARAEKIYAEIATQFPRSGFGDDILYRMAARRDQKDKRADALKLYRELLIRHPRSQWADVAAWRIGFAHFEEGRSADALAAFESAMKRYPRSDYSAAMGYWRGRILEQSGDPRAIAQYREVLRTSGQAYYRGRAAVAYRRLGGSISEPEITAACRLAEQGDIPAALADLRVMHYVAAGETAAQVRIAMQNLLRRMGYWDALARFSSDALDAEALTWDVKKNSPVLVEIRSLIEIGAYDQAAGELLALGIDGGLRPEKKLALARVLAEGGKFRLAIREMESLVGSLGGIYHPAAFPEVVSDLLFPHFYGAIVKEEARKQGLDPLFVLAVIREESRFDQEIASWAGAQGLMQIMPATGARIAKSLGIQPFRIDLLHDPGVNIAMGAYYLSQMKAQFGGREFMALSAYNAGPGNTNRWVRENPGLDEEVWIEKIAFRETRNYVKRVLGTYWTYRMNGGLSIEPSPVAIASAQ